MNKVFCILCMLIFCYGVHGALLYNNISYHVVLSMTLIYSLTDFSVFTYLPDLNHFLTDFDILHQEWSAHKRSTPSYGGILLSPDYKHVSGDCFLFVCVCMHHVHAVGVRMHVCVTVSVCTRTHVCLH